MTVRQVGIVLAAVVIASLSAACVRGQTGAPIPAEAAPQAEAIPAGPPESRAAPRSPLVPRVPLDDGAEAEEMGPRALAQDEAPPLTDEGPFDDPQTPDAGRVPPPAMHVPGPYPPAEQLLRLVYAPRDRALCSVCAEDEGLKDCQPYLGRVCLGVDDDGEISAFVRAR